MMEKMIALQQKRRSKKGGFTLVELIVVLVILAILAALLIPALTGYIDKAKQKRIVAETRQVVMAAQTLYDEDYGAGKVTSSADEAEVLGVTGYVQCTKDNIADLAEIKTPNNIESVKVKSGKISYVKYKDGKTCIFDGSTYTVG